MAQRDLPEVLTPLGRLMSRSCGDATPAPQAATLQISHDGPSRQSGSIGRRFDPAREPNQNKDLVEIPARARRLRGLRAQEMMRERFVSNLRVNSGRFRACRETA